MSNMFVPEGYMSASSAEASAVDGARVNGADGPWTAKACPLVSYDPDRQNLCATYANGSRAATAAERLGVRSSGVQGGRERTGRRRRGRGRTRLRVRGVRHYQDVCSDSGRYREWDLPESLLLVARTRVGRRSG